MVNLKCRVFGSKTALFPTFWVFRVVSPIATVRVRVEQDLKPTWQFGPVDNTTDTDSSTGSGTMTKSIHTYYLMKGVPTDDDWRFCTQLMYDKIDKLAAKPEEVVAKFKAHEVRLQKEDDLDVAAMFSKFRTKSKKWNSKQTQNSQSSRDSDCESDGSSSKSEKHRTRHTQESYGCHQVGHIARYCPSTVPVDNSAPTETAAAAETMSTSIENHWMTVTGRSPEKVGWYLDFAMTSHICGDRRKFEWYTEYTKRHGQELREFKGRVAGKAIGHGDVRLRFWHPGGRHHMHEVVVRNVLHVEEAHNSVSQSWLKDWGLQIVPFNGYGIKIYDKAPAESTGQGRGNLGGVAGQIGGLCRLDVNVAGKSHRTRG